MEYKNTQIPYTFMKNAGKETIVLLHPAFADHTIFEPQIAGFSADYQLILIDMPGHGENPNRTGKLKLSDMPEIINQICIDNDIDTCHLLGVSLGSLVAQAFATRYPERVSSVIIVGGYSIHKANKAILSAQRKEGLKWSLYILFSMNKFRKYVTTVSCYTERGRELFGRGIRHFRRSSFPAMSGMNTFFTNKDSPVLYPLLIVVGEHDLKLARDAAIELHDIEEHSQYSYISGAGHCANVDCPDEFNDVVRSFISANQLY